VSALPADPPSVRDARSADAPGIAEVHVASWRAAYAGQLPDGFLRKLSVDERTRSWRSRIAARRADETVLVAVRGDTRAIVTEHRPVPLWQHMLVGTRLFDLLRDAADDGGRGGSDGDGGEAADRAVAEQAS